ncbi:hypothetical protein D0T12_04545 [Actinomadura spongiicola]|uniref:Uncharacterized protein n=1 Tax=Actinomadura spongiicola TaxID=2303421 RepID=A0A372GQ21_9ACTN|nr:hypothetical protein [Actinomadura spongiicola]RFS87491.1 hypothetical protein D0T12_04545 [Actinomadura spongiicola]
MLARQPVDDGDPGRTVQSGHQLDGYRHGIFFSQMKIIVAIIVSRSRGDSMTRNDLRGKKVSLPRRPVSCRRHVRKATAEACELCDYTIHVTEAIPRARGGVG